jgi:hypothetical protein
MLGLEKKEQCQQMIEVLNALQRIEDIVKDNEELYHKFKLFEIAIKEYMLEDKKLGFNNV